MSFFGDSYNEKKLKANLKLAINRLKLVEKKKTEIALRARKEISDYIKVNKIERARIRVEHIIREDYLVEALEIIEMQCDLLLARIALLGGKGKNKVPHVSLHEAVDSILWSYPQVSGDCQELKIVVGQLAILFGKQYVHEVQNKAGDENPHVNKKLVSRLDPSTPKAFIIETYLQAIAEAYDVHYEADQAVMAAYARQSAIKTEDLINMGNKGNDDDFSKFMPPPPGGAPGGASGGAPGGNSGGSYPVSYPTNQQAQSNQVPPSNQFATPHLTGPQSKPFAYPQQQPQQNNEWDSMPTNSNKQNDQFDEMPPSNFVAPTSPAPQPPTQPTSTAPGQGFIYDDGTNLNNDMYQAPSIRPVEQNRGAKAKEAEQQYTGGQSSSVQPPPNYMDVNSNGVNVFGNNQQQPRQSSNDDEFDLDAMMPQIPTGFKGNNNDDDNNQQGGAGGGDDFDDLEARFANLKK